MGAAGASLAIVLSGATSGLSGGSAPAPIEKTASSAPAKASKGMFNFDAALDKEASAASKAAAADKAKAKADAGK